MSSDDQIEPAASKLGTKEYWDEVYHRELNNFRESGDPGEVWFGEDPNDRVIKWLTTIHPQPKDARILDVGCGNGVTLEALAEAEFTHLYGADYSPDGIELAKANAEEKQFNAQFFVADVLVPDQLTTVCPDLYHIAIDKGTYDAISLSPEGAAARRDAYRTSLHQAITANGVFIITSCNWTKEELICHFESLFTYVDHVKYPVFRFGGKEGQKVATVMFSKK